MIYFESILLLSSIGNLIFSHHFKKEGSSDNYLNWIAFGLSLIYALIIWFVPSRLFMRKILRIRPKVRDERIPEDFDICYIKTNPATKNSKISR
jgi:hypothetical protein